MADHLQLFYVGSRSTVQAPAMQALEWGTNDAMEGPRGSSGGLGAPQLSQQRADPKEDASRIIEDILTVCFSC